MLVENVSVAKVFSITIKCCILLAGYVRSAFVSSVRQDLDGNAEAQSCSPRRQDLLQTGRIYVTCYLPRRRTRFFQMESAAEEEEMLPLEVPQSPERVDEPQLFVVPAPRPPPKPMNSWSLSGVSSKEDACVCD